MVKADPTRNYYADLGIAANADENDIRKAFRQLALKCHPDRNPGHEQEFVAKFQQIQAAHEVLGDATQRAKYDSDRRKFKNLNIPPYNPNTPRARPPPPPRNAYTTTPSGSYYRPPPPKPQPPPQRPPPPQHHPTFSNGADRFTSKNFRAPPTAQRPDTRQKEAEARANVFSAWQKMKQPRAEDLRPHNPSNPNNLNNPNGAPFGRSNSTRVPSNRRDGFDPGTPGGDERQAKSSYRSNYERPGPSPSIDEKPPKGFAGHPIPEDVPFAEGNRFRTPYASAAKGERTSMFGEKVGRSTSVRNSPTHGHRPTSSQDPGFHSDSGHGQQRNSYGGHTNRQPIPNMYVDSSDEEEAEVFQNGMKHRGPPPSKESLQEQPSWGPGMFGTPQKSSSANNSSPNPFKSRSEEGINMKFSPSDWHGKFEGKPDYFAPNIQKRDSKQGRTSPTRGRANTRSGAERNPFSGLSQPPPPVSPFSNQQTSQMPPPPPPPHPPPPLNAQTAFPSDAQSAPHTAKFAPEAWAETFKEANWALPVSKETSPRRGSSSTTKRPNAARKSSLVSDSNTRAQAGKPKFQAFAEDSNGDAMDIDEIPPAISKTRSVPAVTIPPPPRRSPKQKSTKTGTVPNGNTAAPPPAAAKPTPGLNGLSGLVNVEPFLATKDGLGGLGDLKSQLPFESQASSSHPTKPNTVQKLKCPTVPQAPEAPTKLDVTSVNVYFTQMEGYVRQYRQYNDSMTKHFAARNAELAFELDDRFVHARGETTQKLGFASYVKKMKEDEEVMTVWKVAQEMHIKALELCGDVRNKTAKRLDG